MAILRASTLVHTHSPVPSASLPCTAFRVRSLSRRITQLYDDTLAPSGLRSTQFSLLAHVRRTRAEQGPSVTELADRLRMDRTTLTRNLRPLLAAGLVSLQSGADARRKAVVITPAGEAAFCEARELWKHAQQRVRTLGGASTIAQLERLIDSLLPRFEASEVPPP